MRTQHQTRLQVRDVPRLRPEPPRVRVVQQALAAVAVGKVQVRLVRVATGIQALRHCPPYVEAVEGAPAVDRAARVQAREQAVGPEHVGRGQCTGAVVLADRLAAVVEEVGARRGGPGLLPRPQAVPAPPIRLRRAIRSQPVLRVKREGLGMVVGRVAVVGVGIIGKLVVGVKDVGIATARSLL